MLYLVGLGLGDAKDITVKGLEIVKKADYVFLEAYTSILCVGKEVLVSTLGLLKLQQSNILFASVKLPFRIESYGKKSFLPQRIPFHIGKRDGGKRCFFSEMSIVTKVRSYEHVTSPYNIRIGASKQATRIPKLIREKFLP